MLKAEAVDVKYFPIYYEFPDLNKIMELFQSVKSRQVLDPLNEIDTQEHREIDKMVFHYLEINETKSQDIIDLLKSKIYDREKKSRT